MEKKIYGGSRQAVKTSDCGSDMHGFESHQTPHKKDFGICQGLFYLSDEYNLEVHFSWTDGAIILGNRHCEGV